ncbi:M23 family metallopeptidase [Glycomyces sp. MUSA5-2]|uniref:M23 family metallopeptidase n=1 Tax=Glycomyces sp. MUSA5-2 TaxID=2053002 RepID=UPI00300BDC6C
MRRLIILALLGLCAFGACAVLTVVSGTSDQHSAIGTGGGACDPSPDDLDAVAAALGSGYGRTQADHAVTIWQTATGRDLPERAGLIALATAMQESTLRVLANPAVPASLDLPHDGLGEDHDSVGLFQQRPHWGDLADLMDPAASTNLFLDALEDVEGWESMSLAAAAQAVQVSAFPDAYAKHESAATAAAKVIAAIECGWIHPVAGYGVNSGWRTSERPTHNGVDLAAPRGTEILAAAAGEVVTVVCNAHNGVGRQLSCDVDGSPGIAGCGWYVEVAHAEGLLTRYCHMGERPAVSVGDQVAPGDLLGYVGSSGRSSGPHLHLEVHTSHHATFDTAIEPVAAFEAKGVQL